jgi:hypothetical protein
MKVYIRSGIELSNYIVDIYINYENCIIRISGLSDKIPHKRYLRKNLLKYISLNSTLNFHLNVYDMPKEDLNLGGKETDLGLEFIENLISVSDKRFVLKKYNRLLTNFISGNKRIQ